jgi:nicotinamidase/pyrazinamidase
MELQGIHRDKDALLVIDVQNDFCPGGALAVPQGDEVVGPINELMEAFAHVILTQDWHPAGHASFASTYPGKKPYDVVRLDYGDQVLWPDHCVPGTRGADFHPSLRTERATLILRKGWNPKIDSYSAFFENDRKTATGLEGYLKARGIRRLFLAGLATDFCVAYSALDAVRLGFEVVVLLEACRGIDLDGSMSRMLEAMKRAKVVLAEGRGQLI